MSFKPEYFCHNCKLTQPKATSTLKTCSRCKMVKYCGKECQSSHFPEHKNFCSRFTNLINNLSPTAGLCVNFWFNFLDELDEFRINQDYFAYERILEIFNNEKFLTLGSILPEAYYFLGQDDNAIESLTMWEKSGKECLDRNIIWIGLKLNKVAKARENPTEKAVEFYGIFRDVLLKSSEKIHLKVAISSPVMEKIQEYINFSFVEELQYECVSHMISAFKDKREAYGAFSSVAVGVDNFKNRYFYDFYKYYFGRHPEFQQVFQKYKEVYEKNFM